MTVIDDISNTEYKTPMKLVILRTDEKIHIDADNNVVKGYDILKALKDKHYIPKIGIFHVYDDEYVVI